MSPEDPKHWPALTSRQEFAFLTELVLQHAKAEHVWIALHDQHSGTVRFANNQVIQHLHVHTVKFLVTMSFGKKCGTAATTDLTAGSVRKTVQRAEALARAVPEDPEFLPPPARQQYAQWPTYQPETGEADSAIRLQHARKAIDSCQAETIQGAGYVTSSVMCVGVSANTGVFGYEPRTDARFSLTAQSGEASGWTAALHRSIKKLDVESRSLLAIDTCKRGKAPRKMPAGRYTVILQPPAVAGMLQAMLSSLDAKSYDTQTSPFSGKLYRPVLDSRLSLFNRPDHPDLMGDGFTKEGLPVTRVTWVEHGLLRLLAYDRYTAHQKGIALLPTLESPYLEGEPKDQSSTEELIEGTERGIYVSNFWYIRTVNRRDLTLTGTTRDGTFLIENGKVTTALQNFRFHESPLRAFQNIGGYTEPQETSSLECGKMLVPALKIHDFYFSSLSGT